MVTNSANIVITGFMGTGKTTVGREVAALIDRVFVDMDDEIIGQAGTSIPLIFSQGGEAGFRRIEAQVVEQLASRAELVIATGGGALVNETNRTLMLDSGFVVCLFATPEEIEKRLREEAHERPLLRGNWRALLEERSHAYNAIPHQIDTTGKTPEQVAEEVVALWQQNVSE